MNIEIKRLPNGKDLQLPEYKTAGSAGMDIVTVDDGYIAIGETAMLHTGFALAIPKGYEVQIRSRSGLAKKGVFVTNAPGTIDSDYRGEICVLLTNGSADKPFYYHKGDRVAQMIVAPVVQATLVLVDELDTTARGSGGFGSTGK